VVPAPAGLGVVVCASGGGREDDGLAVHRTFGGPAVWSTISSAPADATASALRGPAVAIT
jgi:hypothetical protein